MRQVINGRVYDTEKAQHIHDWNNGYCHGDLKYRYKALYRTAKGNWFIYHKGGPMTDMAVRVGSNSWGGDEQIEPISTKDAKAFLESHGGSEALLEWFGDELEEA